jgi:serine/threonine protein kinase
MQELHELHEQLIPVDQGGEPMVLFHHHTNIGQVHPCEHVLSFYGAFAAPGGQSIQLVTEYMDNGNLEEIVLKKNQGVHSEPVLRHIAISCLKGLQHLHNHSTVHLDIKPSNVLLNHDGRVKIGDLGLAKKLIKGQSTDTEAGTLHYLAPERFQGQTSFAADIWAFGASLHFAALGKHPYSESLSGFIEFEESLTKNVEPIQPLPSTKFSDVTHLDGKIHDCFSAALIDFCGQCMTKDPAVRPSAEKLLEHSWSCSHEQDSEDEVFKTQWVKFMETKKFDGAKELAAIADAVVAHPMGRDRLAVHTPKSQQASSRWKSLRKKFSPRLETSISSAATMIISSWASIKTLAESLDLHTDTVASAFEAAFKAWQGPQGGSSCETKE